MRDSTSKVRRFVQDQNVSDEQITTEKKVEAELRRSEKRYRSLFNQLKDGIIICGPDGLIHEINNSGCEMLGHTHEEVLGSSIEKLLYYKIDAKEKELSVNYLNTKKVVEKTISRDNGSQIILEITTQLLEDGRYLSTLHDITKQKEAYNKLERALEESFNNKKLLEARTAELIILSDQLSESEQGFKELNAGKDKFFSILAHDLKSPFFSIVGFSDLLLSEHEQLDREEIHEHLSSLNKSIKNIYKLIENLLDWSRLQTGKMECSLQKINLLESILYSMSFVISNSQNKEIRIVNNVSDIIYVNADERMLTSVLTNLLSNAIKFTQRGGTVTVNAQPKNIFIEIIITDTGVGIDRESLENIFRIDVNHTSPGTEYEKGTGLGLIICKEMIEKQGGAIKINSEKGLGTTISFILPQWNEEEL